MDRPSACAAGGVPGGSGWEQGDLCAESWLGELRSLREINLCNAVTVIRQSMPPAGGPIWHILPQLIREGKRLTEDVLQTLAEDLWLRKWSGQLQLVESHEDC